MPLTPACSEKPERTPSQTAGPFFTPDSPRRNSLVEPGSRAERLTLAGLVLSPQCKPVANALLDFWHCDEAGAYDNKGFRYRRHVFADAQGRYSLETIVPGEYPGRTRHIHVKVQAPHYILHWQKVLLMHLRLGGRCSAMVPVALCCHNWLVAPKPQHGLADGR